MYNLRHPMKIKPASFSAILATSISNILTITSVKKYTIISMLSNLKLHDNKMYYEII